MTSVQQKRCRGKSLVQWVESNRNMLVVCSSFPVPVTFPSTAGPLTVNYLFNLIAAFTFSDGDRRLRCLRPVAIDVLLQRRQVRLRHPGRKHHIRDRRGGRGKVSEKRHRAEAAAAAATAVVAGGGHQSLCEARFHDLRRGLQEKVG